MHPPPPTVHPEKMLKPKVLPQTSVQYLHRNHHVPAVRAQLKTPPTLNIYQHKQKKFTSSILHKSWHHCSSFGHHRSQSSQCQRQVLFPTHQCVRCQCLQMTHSIENIYGASFKRWIKPEVKSWSVSYDHLVERCTLHQCQSCEDTYTLQ